MSKCWTVLSGDEGNPINLINSFNIFEDENWFLSGLLCGGKGETEQKLATWKNISVYNSVKNLWCVKSEKGKVKVPLLRHVLLLLIHQHILLFSCRIQFCSVFYRQKLLDGFPKIMWGHQNPSSYPEWGGDLGWDMGATQTQEYKGMKEMFASPNIWDSLTINFAFSQSDSENSWCRKFTWYSQHPVLERKTWKDPSKIDFWKGWELIGISISNTHGILYSDRRTEAAKYIAETRLN